MDGELKGWQGKVRWPNCQSPQGATPSRGAAGTEGGSGVTGVQKARPPSGSRVVDEPGGNWGQGAEEMGHFWGFHPQQSGKKGYQEKAFLLFLTFQSPQPGNSISRHLFWREMCMCTWGITHKQGFRKHCLR